MAAVEIRGATHLSHKGDLENSFGVGVAVTPASNVMDITTLVVVEDNKNQITNTWSKRRHIFDHLIVPIV